MNGNVNTNIDFGTTSANTNTSSSIDKIGASSDSSNSAVTQTSRTSAETETMDLSFACETQTTEVSTNWWDNFKDAGCKIANGIVSTITGVIGIKELGSIIKEACCNLASNVTAIANATKSWDTSKSASSDQPLYKMSIEEREAYLEDAIENVESVRDEYQLEYDKAYGKGIPITDEEASLSLLRVFNSLRLNDFLGWGHLLFMYNNEGGIDIDSYDQMYQKAEELGMLDKLNAYMNGASWEESGLAELFEYFSIPYTEDDFLFRLYESTDLYSNHEYGKIDSNEARAHLKKYFEDNNIMTFYEKTNESLAEARMMQTDLSILEMQIYNLQEAAKLLPYEAVAESPEFAEYIIQDYTSYDKMDPDNLKYMDQREVAIYAYLYDQNPKEAEAYLEALTDTMNKRKGMEAAINYITSMSENGGGIEDMFISAGHGTWDGIQNFGEGFIDLICADGVVSAHEYEMMFKVSLLTGEENEYNKNIDPMYRQALAFNYQTWQSIGNMAIPSLVSFIPVVGKPLGLALMGVSSAGNATESAMQSGATGLQAYLYGICIGLSETVLTKYIGGIPGLSETGKSFFMNMLGEAGEEFMQTWLDAGLRATILGEPIDLTATTSESLYAALQGALVSGMMQGGTNVAFTIGNEIVYWSNSEFNSLTEILADANGKGDAYLINKLLQTTNNSEVTSLILKLLLNNNNIIYDPTIYNNLDPEATSVIFEYLTETGEYKKAFDLLKNITPDYVASYNTQYDQYGFENLTVEEFEILVKSGVYNFEKIYDNFEVLEKYQGVDPDTLGKFDRLNLDKAKYELNNTRLQELIHIDEIAAQQYQYVTEFATTHGVPASEVPTLAQIREILLTPKGERSSLSLPEVYIDAIRNSYYISDKTYTFGTYTVNSGDPVAFKFVNSRYIDKNEVGGFACGIDMIAKIKSEVISRGIDINNITPSEMDSLIKYIESDIIKAEKGYLANCELIVFKKDNLSLNYVTGDNYNAWINEWAPGCFTRAGVAEMLAEFPESEQLGKPYAIDSSNYERISVEEFIKIILGG